MRLRKLYEIGAAYRATILADMIVWNINYKILIEKYVIFKSLIYVDTNTCKNRYLRADHEQANRTCLSRCKWIEHKHSNFEQRIVCADAHIHQRNESKDLGWKKEKGTINYSHHERVRVKNDSKWQILWAR